MWRKAATKTPASKKRALIWLEKFHSIILSYKILEKFFVNHKMKLEIFETLHGYKKCLCCSLRSFSNKTNLQVKVKQLSVDIQWKFIFHFLDSTMFNKKGVSSIHWRSRMFTSRMMMSCCKAKEKLKRRIYAHNV